MYQDPYDAVKAESVKGTRPAVFMFQPTSIRRLSAPQLLKQWEDDLKERVGFTAEISQMSGSATECCCPATDDCDV